MLDKFGLLTPRQALGVAARGVLRGLPLFRVDLDGLPQRMERLVMLQLEACILAAIEISQKKDQGPEVASQVENLRVAVGSLPVPLSLNPVVSAVKLLCEALVALLARGDSDISRQSALTALRQAIRLRNSYRMLKLLAAKVARAADESDRFPPERMMRMVFWQEFLYGWPRDAREALASALFDSESANSLAPEARHVLEQAGEPLRRSLGREDERRDNYERCARFASLLVLPHGD